jgi:hypothetical protein
MPALHQMQFAPTTACSMPIPCDLASTNNPARVRERVAALIRFKTMHRKQCKHGPVRLELYP